ncbi:hypothetical protein DLEV_041 [Diachasmimorpha longicaudata entomopoxvirus]|uniref:Uncharacterized protein n=1 Tax=Diachasmimorpha longicaudata entomopoxvirus TaxID=109981 RepID=A0A7R5WCX6_9POXV|nr:hypothetical protein QKK69_gp041 [Diachasmimorpha longicaudata entomopoxvirus]AKS26332.1 hypothetical protein DLEV_041 [Diachasmimorpha longicaudata entomopoxvirus]
MPNTPSVSNMPEYLSLAKSQIDPKKEQIAKKKIEEALLHNEESKKLKAITKKDVADSLDAEEQALFIQIYGSIPLP